MSEEKSKIQEAIEEMKADINSIAVLLNNMQTVKALGRLEGLCVWLDKIKYLLASIAEEIANLVEENKRLNQELDSVVKGAVKMELDKNKQIEELSQNCMRHGSDIHKYEQETCDLRDKTAEQRATIERLAGVIGRLRNEDLPDGVLIDICEAALASIEKEK